MDGYRSGKGARSGAYAAGHDDRQPGQSIDDLFSAPTRGREKIVDRNLRLVETRNLKNRRSRKVENNKFKKPTILQSTNAAGNGIRFLPHTVCSRWPEVVLFG